MSKLAPPSLTTLAIGSLIGLLSLAQAPNARAQSSIFCPGGFSLQGNICVSNPGVVDPAGLSGAALASQALTDLSQSTTQETNRTLGAAIKERREQEEERCPAGFSRVDGACERTPAPTAEAAPPAAAPPSAAPPAAPEKTVKKPRKRVEAVKPAPAPKPAPKAVVRKEEELVPAPLPAPIEPEVRYGSWAQVYGNYERRNATGPEFEQVALAGLPTQTVTLDASVRSQSGMVGFLVGADATKRGVLFGNDGVMIGIMVGYVSSHINLQSLSNPASAVTGCNFNCTGLSHTFAKLSGPSGGAYLTYFDGGFSTDGSLKIDALTLNENFDDFVTLFAPSASGVPVLDRQAQVVNAGDTYLLNTTLSGNVNYRFDIPYNMWIEPTAGIQYINSSYGSDAAQLALADGSLLMIQGGARLGANFLWSNVRATVILTGLAYDDVVVSGGFIAGAGGLQSNILAHADEGQVRGRGILALNLDFGQGVKAFVQGEAYGGQGLFGAGGKAGVRYEW
jgi:outer membrane biosynthesis protein TonB